MNHPPRLMKIFLASTLALLSACHSVQAPAPVTITKPAPLLSISSSRLTYLSADAKQLGFTKYLDDQDLADTAIIYLNNLDGHAAWFNTAGELLLERGYDSYALDWRGSGMNRENRGYAPGDLESHEALFSDLRSFILALKKRYTHLVLSGSGWGAKLALAYALSYPKELSGIILLSPELLPTDSSLSPIVRLEIRYFAEPDSYYSLDRDIRLSASSKLYRKAIEEDPLRLKSLRARFFRESLKLDQIIERKLPESNLPKLVFFGQRNYNPEVEYAASMLSDQGRVDIFRYEDQSKAVEFEAADLFVPDTVSWLTKIIVPRLK